MIMFYYVWWQKLTWGTDLDLAANQNIQANQGDSVIALLCTLQATSLPLLIQGDLRWLYMQWSTNGQSQPDLEWAMIHEWGHDTCIGASIRQHTRQYSLHALCLKHRPSLYQHTQQQIPDCFLMHMYTIKYASAWNQLFLLRYLVLLCSLSWTYCFDFFS